MMKNMTALMSAFVRAYHAQTEGEKVFYDGGARALLGEDYCAIAASIEQGAEFFGGGTLEECVAKLAGAPLERAAFAKDALKREVELGASQYLILGAGYDSFSYMRPDWAQELEIYELDRQEVFEDKALRAKNAGLEESAVRICADLSKTGWSENVKRAGLDPSKKTVCAMLGLSYYLTDDELDCMLNEAGGLMCAGSALVMDYPDEEYFKGKGNMSVSLAAGAGENMKSGLSYEKIQDMLEKAGLLIYEHLDSEQAGRFFEKYNAQHEQHPIFAEKNVCLIHAVKK